MKINIKENQVQLPIPQVLGNCQESIHHLKVSTGFYYQAFKSFSSHKENRVSNLFCNREPHGKYITSQTDAVLYQL